MDRYLEFEFDADFENAFDRYLSVDETGDHFQNLFWDSIIPQFANMQNEAKEYVR